MDSSPNRLFAKTGPKWRNRALSALLGIVIVYLLVFLPLPYFIYKPGTAENVHPMVHVDGDQDKEAGVFMLTTVRVLDANIVNYLYALVAPFQQITTKKTVFRAGESEQEYSERQSFVMKDSQSNAIQAAYREAGIGFHNENEGIIVLQVLENMPASKVLQAGDYIRQVDDLLVTKLDDLLSYIRSKKPGETVNITYERKKVTRTKPIRLGVLPPDANNPNGVERPGLGVVPAEVHSVKADDPSRQVTIKAGDIGGPSAGLMFTLEIFNQLTSGDLTKGYRIAGTGTIDTNGRVGVIGGIQHKIVAANREKADIFFAPKDLVPSKGAPIRNTTDALEQAEKINSRMKVVSVGTLEDALNYLQSLPPKPSASNENTGDKADGNTASS
jgi:PDZ domain-containing protein